MKFIDSMALVFATLVKPCLSFSLANVHQQTRSVQDLGVEGADAKKLDTALASNADAFKSIVKLHNDPAMSDFVKRLLAGEDKFVPQDLEGELSGFVEWFSGTHATQSFAQMQKELSGKPWVKDLKNLNGGDLSEGDYQAVAALRNNSAMQLFADALLEGENRFVPEEREDEILGFIPWFSGVKATQSLAKMRSELLSKPWVHKVEDEATAAEETTSVGPGSLRDKLKLSLLKFVGSLSTWWVSNSSQEAVSNQPTPNTTYSDCIIWGDAKILSFNAHRVRAAAHPDKEVALYARNKTKDQFTAPEAGTYWLVKGADMQIQGRYWRYNRTRPGIGLGAIAISGPMVGHDMLVIRSLSGEVTFNDKEILQQANSSFANEFMAAQNLANVGPVAANTQTPGVKLEFANGVRIVVARYRKKLSARISICNSDPGAAPLEGQCGNLKAIPRDSAHVWLAMQRAAGKLQKSEVNF